MKASKKLITASFALVAALAVSVGTTYAWFTTNNKVTVENINASVTTGDSNLEVALVGDDGVLVGTFGYSLDLGEKLADMLANTKFDALTDQGALTKATDSAGAKWGEAGSTKNGLALLDKKGGEAKLYDGQTNKTGNYLAFTLRFRTPISSTTTNGVDLKLTYSTDAVTSKHDNKEGTGKDPGNYAPLVATDGSLNEDWSIAKDGKIETEAKDAVRIAFHEVDATTHAVKDNTGKAGKVWTPNVGFGNSGTTSATLGGSYTKNLAQYVEAMFTEEKGADWFAGLYSDPGYTKFTPAAGATSGSTPSDTVVQMKDDATSGYCTADLRVVIWLEGTDADCLNSIFSDVITIKLGFEIPEAQD